MFVRAGQRIVARVEGGVGVAVQQTPPRDARFLEQAEQSELRVRQIAPVRVGVEVLDGGEVPFAEDFPLIGVEFERQMNVDPAVVVEEFREAAAQTRAALEGYGLPEVSYFLETFLESFSLTLDELK